MRKRYVFRTANTPEGFLTPTELHLRVRAALEDTAAAGIPVEFDPVAMVTNDRGDQVTVELTWGEGVGPGQAQQYLAQRHVAVEAVEDL